MKLTGELGANNIKVTVFGTDGKSAGVKFTLGHEDVLHGKKGIFEVLEKKGLQLEEVKAFALILPFGPEKAGEQEDLKEKITNELEKLEEVYPSYIPFAVKFLRKLLAEKGKIPVSLHFDTAFFKELPEEELYYAIPKNSSEKNKLKKSGYHGIYHSYAAGLCGKNKKIISVVMDKKTTVAGSDNKIPQTISLGSTPLEGIMSLTTSGDFDPGAAFYIMKKAGYSIHKMDEILKKQSGFLGITDYKMEMKDLLGLCGKDKKVNLAFDIYRNQILKYMGGTLAILSDVDAIVFSGAEADSLKVLIYDLMKQMSFLGIHLKESPWEKTDMHKEISTSGSKIKILINYKSMSEIVAEK